MAQVSQQANPLHDEGKSKKKVKSLQSMKRIGKK